MRPTVDDVIKKFAHMIKDQRGYTVEDFQDILTELVYEMKHINERFPDETSS